MWCGVAPTLRCVKLYLLNSFFVASQGSNLNALMIIEELRQSICGREGTVGLLRDFSSSRNKKWNVGTFDLREGGS